MKTDMQLKKDIEAELEWDPAVHASKVGVAVTNGVVTLTGHLDTYAEKHAIERAMREVEGVRGVALEFDVKLDPGHHRSDSEIVAAAEKSLLWHVLIPAEKIQVIAEMGWITLKGEVDWDYQRSEAEKVVRSLKGVVGISNAITLKNRVMPADVSQRIHDALTRHADTEAKGIVVSTSGGEVTLRGHVTSWWERAKAYRAAWSAPGVTSVVNELKVQM
jgi:osmotically-inducible protein OsmY